MSYRRETEEPAVIKTKGAGNMDEETVTHPAFAQDAGRRRLVALLYLRHDPSPGRAPLSNAQEVRPMPMRGKAHQRRTAGNVQRPVEGADKAVRAGLKPLARMSLSVALLHLMHAKIITDRRMKRR